MVTKHNFNVPQDINDMNIDSATLKAILLKENYVTAEEIAVAEKYIATHPSSLEEYLLENDILTADLLGQAIAESLGKPYADLKANRPTQDQVNRIPENVAKQYRVVLFSDRQTTVVIASDDPNLTTLPEALQALFPNLAASLAYALPEDIEAVLQRYQKALDTRFSKIIAQKHHIAPELLDEIFEDSLAYNASDIHFEPQRSEVIVRFRIDGVLHHAGHLPREFYENILNRVKVQSGLRIDEHMTAQDGSLQFPHGQAAVDMRTSIVPTVEGEKVVLRVLSAYVKGLSLNDLGLTAAHQALFERSAKKPFGMILVTGPTGSGKTTSLYALLKTVNSSDVNITTIEDPVEYKIPGINQIQVNAQTNLTFSEGLRSIVRQDPDIILVGEIRDHETAEIAVNAALTGHLLFSTFHANDAATAIPRLLDMGVEPFLLASTLEIVAAQRLVRKICHQCRHSVTKQVSELAAGQLPRAGAYFPGPTVTVYEGRGCPACDQTGYRGRTAIFEFIQITSAMEEVILHAPSTTSIWALARREGSRSLFEDGLEKVKTGLTTIDELLRVAEPPEQ